MISLIDKKLLGLMKEERSFLILSVLVKFLSLFINVLMIFKAGSFIDQLVNQGHIDYTIIGLYVFLILGRILVSKLASYISFRLSADLKAKLRKAIFEKVYSMGLSYINIIDPAELVQLSVEGVENLETYFGNFIPQLVYSIISPLFLFVILFRLDKAIALALLLLVPAIPVAIMVVQKLAKKVNREYWGSYTGLSEVFLDFLEGLTSLKIYQTDQVANDKLNEYSEDFRVKTMDVLAVQLNNITAMDIVAYLGAALAAIMTFWRLSQGNLSLGAAVIFILIASEFFLPLRQLGSFFHIAMNGMASSDRIFEVLEAEAPEDGAYILEDDQVGIEIKDLSFSYDGTRDVLSHINMEFEPSSLTAITGKSGCGKSTIASLIMRSIEPNEGQVLINGKEDIKNSSRMENFTLVSNSPYLFKGSVRYNLLMGNPKASDSELWEILDILDLREILEKEEGLDTHVQEQGINFSGGQRQRLALARALVKDSNVYIFDEATSNIDTQSEEKIIEVIKDLSKTKTVILISHHLKNSMEADQIYHMDSGRIIEEGNFKELIDIEGEFADLYDQQNSIEEWWIE